MDDKVIFGFDCAESTKDIPVLSIFSKDDKGNVKFIEALIGAEAIYKYYQFLGIELIDQ